MFLPANGDVPPRSIQIKMWPDKDVDEEIRRVFDDVREEYEIRDNDLLIEEIQHVGMVGAPAEAYAIIAAKSAAGTVGVLAVKEIYEYIYHRYVVEDEPEDTDGPIVQINNIYINLSDEELSQEACRARFGTMPDDSMIEEPEEGED